MLGVATHGIHEGTTVCSRGDYSLIFERIDHSWHAVREIKCPEDRIRRISFIVG